MQIFSSITVWNRRKNEKFLIEFTAKTMTISHVLCQAIKLYNKFGIFIWNQVCCTYITISTYLKINLWLFKRINVFFRFNTWKMSKDGSWMKSNAFIILKKNIERKNLPYLTIKSSWFIFYRNICQPNFALVFMDLF